MELRRRLRKPCRTEAEERRGMGSQHPKRSNPVSRRKAGILPTVEERPETRQSAALRGSRPGRGRNARPGLRCVSAPLRSGSAVNAPSDFVQTILFTDNEELIRAEVHNVYSHEDLEDGLQIFDNGQKLGGSSGARVEDVVRPNTSVAGAAPPTARRGARPTLGAGTGGLGSNPRLHANPQAAFTAAQARRPVGRLKRGDRMGDQ